jgi:hypothetical protein
VVHPGSSVHDTEIRHALLRLDAEVTVDDTRHVGFADDSAQYERIQ